MAGNPLTTLKTFALCSGIAALTACGGGSSISQPAASVNISGTAATGAPITGKVIAIDATGQQFPATTNASTGAYTVNVAGGKAPFMLTIVGTSGGKVVSLTSVATAAGQTVNITPLTDLIVSAAAGQPGGTALVNLCTSTVPADKTQCQAALTATTTGTHLSTAVTAIKNMIAPLDATGADPLNGAFTANGAGMDAVLDKILVTPAPALGAMATVTLIAVPSQSLGTVTMPASVGGAATITPVTPLPANITAAAAAITTLAGIRNCMTSLNALYPSTMTTPPTSTQVTPFIDTTFNMGGTANQAAFISGLTTLSSAGGFAQPGLNFIVDGFSAFDFSTWTTTTSAVTTTSPIASDVSYVWVRIEVPAAGGGLMNWKVVKGTAYTGCPAGWKLAGPQHADMHMTARVQKQVSSSPAAITYSRQLPLNMQADEAAAEGIGSVVVTGPGLAVYSGNPASPVGALTPITLNTPAPVTPPAVPSPTLQIKGFPADQYEHESIQSCQDMAALNSATGTPCYDETAVAPGAVYTWAAYDTATPTANLKYSFAYQIYAVPLSVAFAQANDKDLFAQNITTVPATIAALNTAASHFNPGDLMEGVLTFNYTLSSVYGARPDNCHLTFQAANAVQIFEAEADAVRQPIGGCTFTTPLLYTGSLAKPSDPFYSGWASIAVFVLGNQIDVGQPY
jgi:hypothetical protein